MSEAIKTALDYAARGWAVFPIRTGQKIPYAGFKWKDLSSNDPKHIYQWVDLYPDCNWAVDCGKSNIFVVDVDVEGLKSLQHTNQPPPRFSVNTPSGGFHIYYKGDAPNSTSKIAPGIDTRGRGGYVLIPGSVNGLGTPYTWVNKNTPADIPPWIVSKISTTKPKLDRNDDPDFDLDTDLQITAAVDYLTATAPAAIEGLAGDSTTYQVACHLRDLGVSEEKAVELLLEHWNDEKAHPPWDIHELSKKVNNAYTYAKDHVGNKSVESMFSPIPDEPGTRLSDYVLSMPDFQRVKTKPRKHILDPWVIEQTIIMLTANRGVGKTFFALAALDAITRGNPYGPWPTLKSVPCLYYDAELVTPDLQDRLAQICGDAGTRKNPLYILSDNYVSERSKLPHGNIYNPSWRNAIKSVLLERKVGVWVLDNLSSASSGGQDENSSGDWGPVNAWLLELRYKGITTIMAHHTNKQGEQRGTHSREDNIDISIMLQRPRDYSFTDGAAFDVKFTKARLKQADLRKINDVGFRLNESGGWTVTAPKKDMMLEVVRLIGNGWSQKMIGEELGCTKQNVSLHVKTARSKGWIGDDGKIIEAGIAQTSDPFSEL